MAGRRGKAPPQKRHHTERFRNPNLPLERWTNAKSAFIGFHLGRQMSSVDVAKLLRDGTSAPTIRRMIRLWGLPTKGMRRGIVVSVPRHSIAKLEKLAKKRGLTPERYLDRICFYAIRDDMYDAIVDEGGND